jgi:hypothetical protein
MSGRDLTVVSTGTVSTGTQLAIDAGTSPWSRPIREVAVNDGISAFPYQLGGAGFATGSWTTDRSRIGAWIRGERPPISRLSRASHRPAPPDLDGQTAAFEQARGVGDIPDVGVSRALCVTGERRMWL